MKVYNKDCYKGIKSIKDDYIIVTDPPFNIGFNYSSYNDNVLEDDFYTNLSELIRDKEAVVIMYPELLHKLTLKLGYAPTKIISWVYNSHLPREHRDICFYNIKPDFSNIKQPYKNPTDKRVKGMIEKGSKGTNIYDWWKIEQVKNVNSDKYNHPCQMPYKVMDNIIKLLPNKTILDPFAGTGTTLLAAKNNGRDYIGFEIDEEYFNIIQDRLNGVTPKGQYSLELIE